MNRKRISDIAVLVILLIIAGFRYFVPPSTASELYITPDEVEPAVAAQRLVTLGRLDIQVAGKAYPQRYPPLCSLLIAPAYVSAPQQLGAGIIVEWLFALGGIAAAFALGRVLARSTAGGALAAATVLLNPLPARFAGHIITDVPAATLGVVSCILLLLALRRRPQELRWYLVGGAVVAVAYGLRTTSAVLITPWLVLIAAKGGQRFRRVISVAAPLVIAMAATAVYQQREFGDWRRTGYNFWCPVPYDYPWLVFSPEYFRNDLLVLLPVGLRPADARIDDSRPWANSEFLCAAIAGVGGAILLRRLQGPRARLMLWYVVLCGVPISLVYLFYCFPFSRFHTLLLYLASIVGGAGLACAIQRMRWRRRREFALALALVAALASLKMPGAITRPPVRRMIAPAMAKYTPTDAVLITDLDEPYLEPLVLRGTRRTVLPYKRTSQYARLPVAWKKVPDPYPPPKHYMDNRCPGVIAGGAVDLYPVTAMEDPDYVAALVRSGKPVYLDVLTSEPNNPRWVRLLKLVRGEPIPGAPFLVRLLPK